MSFSFYHTFYPYKCTMKDSQPLMTTSVDGFHNENFAPFSYCTITNHLISTNCTTFLTNVRCLQVICPQEKKHVVFCQ